MRRRLLFRGLLPRLPARTSHVIGWVDSVTLGHSHSPDVFADEAAGALGEADGGEDFAGVDVALGGDGLNPRRSADVGADEIALPGDGIDAGVDRSDVQPGAE